MLGQLANSADEPGCGDGDRYRDRGEARTWEQLFGPVVVQILWSEKDNRDGVLAIAHIVDFPPPAAVVFELPRD